MKKSLVVAVLAFSSLLPRVAGAKILSYYVAGATECADGKFSTSSGSGTCSGHGGVKQNSGSPMGNDLESMKGILAEQRKGYSLSDIGAERDHRAAGEQSANAQSGQDSSGYMTSSASQSAAQPSMAGNIEPIKADASSASDSTTLAKTGGNPLLMTLSGFCIAAGALFLRRRIA